MRALDRQKIVTLINMGCSIVIGTMCGLFLNWLDLPGMIVCGTVAIVSTITEHYLIVHKRHVENLLKKLMNGEGDETK